MQDLKAIELEVETMREKLRSLDVYKKNVELTAESGDLKTFLETGVGHFRIEIFYCRGVLLTLKILNLNHKLLSQAIISFIIPIISKFCRLALVTSGLDARSSEERPT